MALNITLDDVKRIHEDQKALTFLIENVGTAYAALSAMVGHVGANFNDTEDEDEDEFDDEDSENIKSLSKSLMVVEQEKQLDSLRSGPDLTKPEYEDAIVFEGVKSTKEEDNTVTLKMLYKMICQAAHPDKIMRFSAVQKKEIMDCYENAREHYEDENYEGLVLEYVTIFLIRGEPKRITYWLWKAVVERQRQIQLHFDYIMEKPFMPACQAYFKKDIPLAKRLFRDYLNSTAMDDMDCFG